jgi:uncharacterized protein
MGVEEIRVIRMGAGEVVRPEWGEGDASPDWHETEYRSFSDESGRLFGGTWEGSPGSLRLDPYPYDEICIMLTGRVALVDTHGARQEFGAGEAFFVPHGFVGTWETIEPSSKIFVALQAAGEPA